MSVETLMVSVKGARLFVRRAGVGPPVVLVHAGIADSRMWDAQLKALSERFTVIAYDVRSYGQSSDPGTAFSDHEDLAGLLKALGIAGAAVVGCSNGGRIALDFALAFPEQLSALVLAAPGLRRFPWSEETRAGWGAEEEAIERGDIAAAAEVNLRMWVDGPARMANQVDPALREAAREMATLCLTRRSGEGPTNPLEPPAIERLGEVRARTLVLAGEQDQPDMLRIADLLGREIPGARKAIVPNAAHLLPMEQPALFNQFVLEFLG